MTQKRISAAILSVVLTALLAWTVIGGVADRRTQIMLGFGAVLGALYAVVGRLPEVFIRHSGGALTEDDDPSNLSPRFYLPIIGGAVLLAALAISIGVLMR
jgi:hypothetical protein